MRHGNIRVSEHVVAGGFGGEMFRSAAQPPAFPIDRQGYFVPAFRVDSRSPMLVLVYLSLQVRRRNDWQVVGPLTLLGGASR